MGQGAAKRVLPGATGFATAKPVFTTIKKWLSRICSHSEISKAELNPDFCTKKSQSGLHPNLLRTGPAVAETSH